MMKIYSVLLLSLFAASAHAAPNDPANCSLQRWTSVQGSVTTGTPLHATPFRRVSEPCAMRTTSAGSFVTDGTPNAMTEYGSRFYFYLSAAAPSPATIFAAVDSNGGTLYSARLNGGNLDLVLGTTVIPIPLRMFGWNSVELRWKAGTTKNFAYHVSYVEPSGAGFATRTQTAILDFATIDRRVEGVRLGQIDGAAPLNLTFDAFASRSTYGEIIGRVTRGDANGDGGVSGPDIVLISNEASGVAMSLAQPDCNEDGGVSGPDIGCATRLASGVDLQGNYAKP